MVAPAGKIRYNTGKRNAACGEMEYWNWDAFPQNERKRSAEP